MRLTPVDVGLASSSEGVCVEIQHQVDEVLTSGSVVACRCTCGWTSTPASSSAHAHRRWKIHFSQQRSARLCSQAWGIANDARHRAAELSVMGERARQRRTLLAEQRHQLRAALQVAETYVDQYRTAPHRMLDCARQLAGLSPSELWLRYLSLGGCLPLDGFLRAMTGTDDLRPVDHELICTALNEEFRDAGFGTPLRTRVGGSPPLSPSCGRPPEPPGSG
jgi:hypothetical protein